ncbi:MAG: ATP-dependent 6-phosphofructokinase [candidate division Zixibacteria bacterium]|nr:ATP-dependent 6-phosphofructokinase [candidate division Zixibacteria bacterium]
MNIGVLTSGGDASGMNAAIRAVVRTATLERMTVFGISFGYKGLCETSELKDPTPCLKQLKTEDVVRILGTGGTILKSARYLKFQRNFAERKQALENLQGNDITGLVVLGGDGSFRGAMALYKTNLKAKIIENLRIICIPCTIDNDIPCTKYTIGSDTALNTVLDCIDKIRDTAYSHKRAFLIQVMGRDCDYLPRMTSISSGAHIVLGPNDTADLNEIYKSIKHGFKKGKEFVIIIVAEGLKRIRNFNGKYVNLKTTSNKKYSAAEKIGQLISARPLEIRPVVLGHVQRGGRPSCFDRILATRFGVSAIKALSDNNILTNQPLMLALQNSSTTEDSINCIPLADVIKMLSKNANLKTHDKYQFISQAVIRGFSSKLKWPEYFKTTLKENCS